MGWRAPIGPECDYGKHDACNGDAWDFAIDEPSPCCCICHRDTPQEVKEDG
jgi:hypothetical protein